MRTYVMSEIYRECSLRNAKWGGPEKDDANSPEHWFSIIEHQIARAADARSVVVHHGRSVDPKYALVTYHADRAAALLRHRLIKIAAVAIAGVESLDRKSGLTAKIDAAENEAIDLGDLEGGDK